jgi:hypothetical protein
MFVVERRMRGSRRLALRLLLRQSSERLSESTSVAHEIDPR